MAVMTMATTIKKLETLSVRNLLADPDLTLDDLKLLFDLTERVKAAPGEYAQALRGKQLAMIFEKPSLRTRTTFEVGITSLGGFAVYLEHTKPRLGEREADTLEPLRLPLYPGMFHKTAHPAMAVRQEKHSYPSARLKIVFNDKVSQELLAGVCDNRWLGSLCIHCDRFTKSCQP